MFILLIIFFLFLFAYILFNVYSIMRVWSLRLPGDKTNLSIVIYLIVIASVMTISIVLVTMLNWQTSLSDLIKIGG